MDLACTAKGQRWRAMAVLGIVFPPIPPTEAVTDISSVPYRSVDDDGAVEIDLPTLGVSCGVQTSRGEKSRGSVKLILAPNPWTFP